MPMQALAGSMPQRKPKRPTRAKLLSRWQSLRSERSSWFSHWQDISAVLLPRNGRFFVTDRNRGTRKHNQIYDSSATRALNTLGAGMMAGATSPARPWFRLATPDPDLNDHAPVKLWLNDVTRLMQMVFQRSNTYRALHTIYEELGAFGTAASIIMPDARNIIHHHVLTVGEYALAADPRGRVNTMYREFEMTVADIVEEFGYDRCCLSTRRLWDNGNLDSWVRVIHAIEPRTDRDARSNSAANMAYGSWYFEPAGEGETVLRESGFDHFPVVAPRWATVGNDVYGHSPAMAALGDIRQLQHEQLRKAQAIDYQTKPPLQVPASLKNREIDTLPGGISYVDGANQGIQAAWEVRLDLSHLVADIVDCRDRIRGTFFADMFLMLASQPNTRMTATEVAERHEEKLLMLGPVLERLHNELLSPLVDTTFNRMVAAGIVPPAPESLQGMELTIEFVSMLAQAQRAIGTNAVDRFVGNLGAIAQMKPDVLDKFDSDRWADVYADMLGVDPSLITADREVAVVRQARDKAAAAKEQVAAMDQAGSAARNLSQADTTSKNALTDAVGMFSGYTTPQAGVV